LDQLITEQVKLNQQIAESDIKIQMLEGLRFELETRLSGLGAHLSTQINKLEASQQLLTDRDFRMAIIDRQLVDRFNELRAVREAMVNGRDKVISLERKLAQCNCELSAVHSSTSWRITAPLRFASRLFGLAIVRVRFWRQGRIIRTIARSGMFDKHWYLAKNMDVAESRMDPIRHYVLFGAREGRDPSASFSTNQYLSRNPHVVTAGANPLEHFIRCGAKEGRSGG
jgi:hypothetical protein